MVLLVFLPPHLTGKSWKCPRLRATRRRGGSLFPADPISEMSVVVCWRHRVCALQAPALRDGGWGGGGQQQHNGATDVPPPLPRAHRALGCPFGMSLWGHTGGWVGDICSALSILCWDVADFLLQGCISVLEAALKLGFPTICIPDVFQT